MLNHLFILTGNPGYIKSDFITHAESRMYLSYLVDHSNVEDLKQAYQLFSGSELKNLSLAIKIRSAIKPNILDYIISFFFLPAYYRADNKIVLNLVFYETSMVEQTKALIISTASSQGIGNLSLNTLLWQEPGTEPAWFPVTGGLYPLFYGTEDVAEKYSSSLYAEPVRDQPLFIYDPPGNKFNELYSLVSRVEEDMKKLHPSLYEACVATRKLTAENDYLKRKCTLTKTELDHCQSHLEILRSTHQAKELQEYYDREYEVLPLWYKRAGHLLKAFMGNRSFKSLFSNSQKKIKD